MGWQRNEDFKERLRCPQQGRLGHGGLQQVRRHCAQTCKKPSDAPRSVASPPFKPLFLQLMTEFRSGRGAGRRGTRRGSSPQYLLCSCMKVHIGTFLVTTEQCVLLVLMRGEANDTHGNPIFAFCCSMLLFVDACLTPFGQSLEDQSADCFRLPSMCLIEDET